MPIFLRALSALNAAREWFSFANEAVSFLGLAKRAVAGAAGAAVIAGTGVSVASVVQDPQKKVISRAISTHVPNITPEIRELVMKASSENVYSKMFLYREENHDLLEAILAVCLDGNALPAEQCDIAEQVEQRVVADERERKMLEARRRASKEVKVGTLKMPWEHGDLVK